MNQLNLLKILNEKIWNSDRKYLFRHTTKKTQQQVENVLQSDQANDSHISSFNILSLYYKIATQHILIYLFITVCLQQSLEQGKLIIMR